MYKPVTRPEKLAFLYIIHLLEKETIAEFDSWIAGVIDADAGVQEETREAFYALCRDIKALG